MPQAVRMREVSSTEGSPAVSDSTESLYYPRLALEKTGWPAQFASSLMVLVHGPAPPKEFLGDPYFRDCWIEQPFPKLAFAAAIVLQILLIAFPPPIWTLRAQRVAAPPPEMELTWYGPAKNLPLVFPAAKMPKAAPRDNPSKATPRLGAEAFHPRQTLLSEPLQPTHPRQTLIQPAAPQAPPKILPALPNIVQLPESQPVRPRLQLTSKELAAMRPKTPTFRAVPNSAAPIISTPEKVAGIINIASSAHAPPKPVLPISPMSAPHVARRVGVTNAKAPDLAEGVGNGSIMIALSATPAAVPPPPAIPPGNLSARISISPDGPRPGAPGGAEAVGVANAEAAGGGGGRGPEGIFISGGNHANTASVSGLGIGPASRGTVNALPARPVPRVRVTPEDSNAPLLNSGSAERSSKLEVPPEKVLGGRQVYTLHVNMPNLTSASGSWVLNFAELDEADPGTYQKPTTSELTGPVPVRKVDPKYPPELRSSHVEGEVVLYAIIRKDGSVDSIQLVHSVDPLLDANAMEALAQWKFQPAEKRGEPVDLEAVVYIPFRSRTSAY
jgi:TonB family protein